MRESISKMAAVASAAAVVLGSYIALTDWRPRVTPGVPGPAQVQESSVRGLPMGSDWSDPGVLPEDAGVSFVPGGPTPKVSRAQAVGIATQAVGGQAAVEVLPAAAYGASTETHFRGRADIKNTMQGRPVWLVKFARVEMRAGSLSIYIPDAPTTLPSVADVFVDADTGRVLLMSTHTLQPVVPPMP